MDILNLTADCCQSASQRIIEAIRLRPFIEISESEPLKIVLFATETGLSCKETAENIAATIENSTDIHRDLFDIISGLWLSDYFLPTTEITQKINCYLKKASPSFESFQDVFSEEDEFFEETANTILEDECHGNA